MIINIPDDCSPDKRKEMLKIITLVYAIEFCKGNKAAAARFLGSSVRRVRMIISKNPEYLDSYCNKKVRSQAKKIKRVKEDDPYRFFPNKKIYERHRERLEISFDYRQLSSREKIVAQKRLKALYE